MDGASRWIWVGGKRRETPEYCAWKGMKRRCLNPRAKDFSRYGGRGITVDPAWAMFSNFLADMGCRPTARHSLERIANDRGYSPGNCMWATRKEQARNRKTVVLTKKKAEAIRALHGVVYDQAGLAKLYGVDPTLVRLVVQNRIWR